MSRYTIFDRQDRIDLYTDSYLHPGNLILLRFTPQLAVHCILFQCRIADCFYAVSMAEII